MSDLLMNLGKNPNARRFIKTLGLPIPLPQKLRRADAPYAERPLQDRRVAVCLAAGGQLTDAVASTLARAGADTFFQQDAPGAFVSAGEAYGRPPQPLSQDDAAMDALVMDASGLTSPRQLKAVYDFLHPLVGQLRRHGRVVILARPLHHSAATAVGDTAVDDTAALDPAAAATQRALDGVVRSLAKEIGKRGSTAQLINVAAGAEQHLEGVLRFVLSARSAFVSGQPLYVSQLAGGAGGDGSNIWTRALEGKIALVTGAARGIGKATARLLAAEGAEVVCLDRPQDDGPLSQVVRAVGGRVLHCDVAAADAPEKVAQALADAGGVDIVVHNAGVTRDKTLARMKESLWDQTIAINLSAVVDITAALLRGPMRDGGRIICLSSVAGIAGNMGQTNYAASKAGVIGFVEALAPLVAARGITANAIAPGFIETRLTAAIPTMIREAGRRLCALGQGGLPVDVAEAITFLATPGAQGLSGNVLRVCGGALIGA